MQIKKYKIQFLYQIQQRNPTFENTGESTASKHWDKCRFYPKGQQSFRVQNAIQKRTVKVWDELYVHENPASYLANNVNW